MAKLKGLKYPNKKEEELNTKIETKFMWTPGINPVKIPAKIPSKVTIRIS